MMKPKTIKNIPQSLLEMNEWLVWYNKLKSDGESTKPPLSQRGYTVKKNSPGHSLDHCVNDLQYLPKEGGGVGFKLNDRHLFIFFDCDKMENIESLPKEFKDFIILQDTYMEYSPSGKGLRIIFRCVDKEKLPDKANLNFMNGELFVRSGHVTITGNHVAGEEIKDIQAYQLEQWYKPKKAEVIDIPTEFNHPDISLIQEALNLCKLDQSDRVKEVYQSVMKDGYNHYYFWFKIMSACHNYALVTNQMAKVTSMVVKWSQTDEIAYEDDEDVIAHWSSLSEEDNQITYATLFKFAKLLRFQWPVEKYVKGEPTGLPVPTDIVNMQALVEYHNLKFFWDIFNRSLYMTGNKDIIEEYFLTNDDIKIHFGMYGPFTEDMLNSAIIFFAQHKGYSGVSPDRIKQLWKAYISGRVDRINSFQLWLETPPDELTKDMIEKDTDMSKSNLDYLLSCITFNHIQNQELAKMYFDTFFYEITMPIYNPQNKYAHRSFLLSLIGPEACHKSTFCTMLFPANLRRQFITTSTEVLGGGKSDRDFKTQLVESVILVVDELKLLFKRQNDAMLKNLITTDVIDLSVIYSKHTEKFNRNAAMIATSNDKNFPFEVDSNRRMALVDVTWIDTDMMEKINWHHFYRSYVAKGKKAMINGTYPWKLSNDVMKLQYQENEKYRSHTELEEVFREIFDFDAPVDYESGGNPQTNKDLYGIKQIKFELLMYDSGLRYKQNALKHELKRICGKYTDTIGKRKPLKRYEGYIENGIIHSGQWIKYVLPPKKPENF